MKIHDLALRADRVPLSAILRSDFYSFVQAAFPIVSGGEELLRNWHLEAMAYALTRVMRGEIRRLIINVPPRSLKSICASVATESISAEDEAILTGYFERHGLKPPKERIRPSKQKKSPARQQKEESGG